MKRNILLSLICSLLLVSCNTNNKESKEETDNAQINVNVNLIMNHILFDDVIATKAVTLNKGDSLAESVFEELFLETKYKVDYDLSNSRLYLDNNYTENVGYDYKFTQSGDVYFEFNLPYVYNNNAKLGQKTSIHQGAYIQKDGDNYYLYYTGWCMFRRKIESTTLSYDDVILFYKDAYKFYYSNKEFINNFEKAKDVNPYTQDKYHIVDYDNNELAFPLDVKNLNYDNEYNTYSFSINELDDDGYNPTHEISGVPVVDPRW